MFLYFISCIHILWLGSNKSFREVRYLPCQLTPTNRGDRYYFVFVFKCICIQMILYLFSCIHICWPACNKSFREVQYLPCQLTPTNRGDKSLRAHMLTPKLGRESGKPLAFPIHKNELWHPNIFHTSI